MKKILILVLCAVMFCAFAVVSSAQTFSDMSVSTEINSEGNSTSEKENATEGEISPDTTIPETKETEPVTEKIKTYITSHLEEISVIVSLIVAAIYSKIKDGKFGASLGTLNSNAINIANRSASIAEEAFEKMKTVAEAVESWGEKINTLIEQVSKSEEEKTKLADSLAKVETFLKGAKLATLELSNEFAELLVLANIPNSVKDELFARHSKAVHEIEAAEEGTTNDGTQA